MTCNYLFWDNHSLIPIVYFFNWYFSYLEFILKKMEIFMLRIVCVLSFLCLSFAIETEKRNAQNEQTNDILGTVKDNIGRLVNYISLKAGSSSSINNLHFEKSLGFNFDSELPLHLSQKSSRCTEDILYTLRNLKEQWALQSTYSLNSFICWDQDVYT